jgi:hypothetical protein
VPKPRTDDEKAVHEAQLAVMIESILHDGQTISPDFRCFALLSGWASSAQAVDSLDAAALFTRAREILAGVVNADPDADERGAAVRDAARRAADGMRLLYAANVAALYLD